MMAVRSRGDCFCGTVHFPRVTFNFCSLCDSNKYINSDWVKHSSAAYEKDSPKGFTFIFWDNNNNNLSDFFLRGKEADQFWPHIIC